MFPAVDAIFVLIPRENHMYLQNCSTSTHGVWPSTVARGKAVGRGRHRWDGDFPFNRPSPVSDNAVYQPRHLSAIGKLLSVLDLAGSENSVLEGQSTVCRPGFFREDYTESV